MKRLFILLAAVTAAVLTQAASVTYTADNTTIFANPERGFITMIGGNLSEKKPYGVKGSESTLDAHASGDMGSLVLVHYYLTNFVNTETIPAKVLNAFDEDMQVLRARGMKAIIRFSYANGTYEKNGVESAKDATLAVAKKHIEQYKSHWQANADVIFCFQAGFIGAWGEWYYTDNYGNQSGTINTNRRALIDALLDAVPADRTIQLRTPLFKTGYVGSTSPLTATEGFSGSAKARLGHHNDAFLENNGDMGTYTDTAKQKPYIAQETLYVPIGGESCILDASVAAANASYAKTTAEMSRLHWTFIQSGYSTVVTNRWRSDGTFDELNRKMGYRFQLVSGTYGDQAAAGGKLPVKMQIKNVGYAPLYNERTAYIVLQSGSKTYSLPLQSDPRRWLPNGVVTTIDEQLTLPSNIPAGTYQLYLYLPDKYASIASNAKYAVRFANTGVWESGTGMNKLNASVTVSSGNTPEPPQPVGDAVLLPATLNKANVASYSSDMSWYNTDYFDFGPGDAENLDRWAEWTVELRYPGKYQVSEEMKSVLNSGNVLGHYWHLQLLDNNSPVAEYTTKAVWEEGGITYDDKWDLSSVAKGVYTLRVQNAQEWGQPKLRSLTLAYDGVLPAGIGQQEADMEKGARYDILGRPVDADYRGIVITRGGKFLAR